MYTERKDYVDKSMKHEMGGKGGKGESAELWGLMELTLMCNLASSDP